MPLQTAAVGDTVQYRDASGGTHNVLVNAVQPTAPSAPSVANSGTGGTLGAATYSYKISRVKNGVEGPASAAGTTVVGAGSTNKCTITLPAEAGVAYRVYGRTGGSELLIATTAVGASSYDDTGSVTPAGAAVTADGRIGVDDYMGGLSSANKVSLLKATTMKQTNRYFKRY